MTREEILNTPKLVDYLLDKSVIADSRMKLHKRLEELCKLAIKALEQEPCEDTISRQEVIETLKELDWNYNGHPGGEVYSAIYKLPPVQPKPKTGWIPVSERLPEIRQHVLCQCRGNNYSVLRLNQDSGWECIYPHTTYMQSFVIAWMPLPEPYEPQESEDKE